MNRKRPVRTAVVTGPTGAIGVALCEELLRRGCAVYAVCRPESPRAAALSEGVRRIFCDLSQIQRLPEIIGERCDAFFHLGWTDTVGPGRDDMPAQIRNIGYTIDAVRAASDLGCRVFVGAGSQAEYGRVSSPLRPDTPAFPESGYGMAKLCAGQMSRVEARKSDVDHVWARILSVYGPHDGDSSMVMSTIRRLLAGERPALTAGEQIWDYLYAADAARALICMAERGADGAVYPVGSGEARPLRRYIEAIRDAVEPALPLGFGEIPYGERQVMHLSADISTLRADTGFAPAVRFEEGIRKTVDWVIEARQKR